MYYLYVNYRENVIRRHSNLACARVQSQRGTGARTLTFADDNVQNALNELRTKIPFADAGGENDLWIENAISDSLQAMRIVGSIKNALADNDTHFKAISLTHCEECGD
ncbi:MAG: hypothetical protein ACPG06_11595 [Alphaproteobacteria bacterium]